MDEQTLQGTWGIGSSRINFTLDGIPLNDPEDQFVYFSNFPDFGNSLESVQIQRGVGTSSYGTAAYAGAINFQSMALASAARSGEIQLGRGSFGTTRGFAEIRPELQRELEGGIDASLLGNRAQLELTGFQRNISDLLIQRTLAPTTGFSQEVYNGASMRVRGFEASLNAFPIQSQALGGISWNVRINFGMNRSKITKLPVPAFLISTPQVGAIQQAVQRKWAKPVGPEAKAQRVQLDEPFCIVLVVCTGIVLEGDNSFAVERVGDAHSGALDQPRGTLAR